MKKITISVLFLFSGMALFAQWECRSKLGASLKPVGESNLMWAGELIGSAGYLSNSYIANGMGFLGIDYSSGKSTLYFEGGIKYWNKKDLDEDIDYDNYRVGLRELFYSYRGERGKLTAGLHSGRLGDHYLLNERLAGVSYRYHTKQWNLNFSTGSVSKDFARNGVFSSTSYLYDIIPIRPNNIGEALGKTNMVGLTLGYIPGKKNDGEQFTESDDEFSAMDDFNKPALLHISEIGIALYTEFGSEINTPFFTSGIYSKITLPGEINFKPEVLFQSAKDNNGFIWALTLDKNLLWGNGHKTTLIASHYSFSKIDEDAVVQNRFSNTLLGEVLRLEATESPLFLLSAKHIVPRMKIHMKTQYVYSNYASSMQEFDIQVGKVFFNQLQINALLGYMKSNLILNDDSAKLARLELRLNF